MSSTYKQRLYGQPKESQIRIPFKGDVHLLQICLNYQGTPSPLNCTIDGDRFRELAKKCGVKNITCIYDNGTTPLYPSTQTVLASIIQTCQKCNPGDYFVLQYSGHGDQVPDQDGDQQDGMDQVFCLRNPDGTDQQLTDDQISDAISNNLNPQAYCLLLVDACHSGTILDTARKGIWKKRKIFCISGCQDTQLSNDTGNGGQMTLALLNAIMQKQVFELRKKRKASIQMVFNRMINYMPNNQQEQGAEQGEDKGMNPYQQYYEQYDYDEFQNDQDYYEGQEYGDYENQYEDQIDDVEPGQNVNLSWCGGIDPTNIPFPF